MNMNVYHQKEHQYRTVRDESGHDLPTENDSTPPPVLHYAVATYLLRSCAYVRSVFE